MQFNRKLQYDVLKGLEEVYPDSLLVSNLPGFATDRNFMGNLFYLKEHGFIEGGDIREPGQCRSMVDAQITKAGLDFLADDGGLPAILGLFQVKMDKAEFVSIIDTSLQKSDVGTDRHEVILKTLSSITSAELKKLIEQYIAVSVVENYEQLSTLLMENTR